VGHDPKIARQCQRKPTASRDSVDGRYDGFGHPANFQDRLMNTGGQLVKGGCRSLWKAEHPFHITASAEGLTLTGDDYPSYLIVYR